MYIYASSIKIYIYVTLFMFPKKIFYNTVRKVLSQITFDFWAAQATSHYLNQRWLDLRRIYASVGLNELRSGFAIVATGWRSWCTGLRNLYPTRPVSDPHFCFRRWRAALEPLMLTVPINTEHQLTNWGLVNPYGYHGSWWTSVQVLGLVPESTTPQLDHENHRNKIR